MRTEPYERERTWLAAMKLAAAIYRTTGRFPQEEKSGLTASLRKTAAAVPAKLADAHGQVDPDAAVRSFDAAEALLRELQTGLQIAGMLRFVSSFRVNRLRGKCQKLARMIEQCAVSCEAARDTPAQAA